MNRHFWKWKEPTKTEAANKASPENAVENDPGMTASEQAEPEDRTLFLYGTIAEESWLDDDVTPALFRNELFADSGPVTIYINSYGGDCVAASQIYSMLMEYPYDVTVKIDGIAASAASVIAMAGTSVLMSPTSCLMIHDPMTLAFGNSVDMQKAIEMLESVKDSIINAYEIKTGLSRAKLGHMMEAETWMDAGKAIELGFADGMLERNASGAVEQPGGMTMLYSRTKVLNSFMDKISRMCRIEATAKNANKEPPDDSQTKNSLEGNSNDEAGATDEPREPDNSIQPRIPAADLFRRLNLITH